MSHNAEAISRWFADDGRNTLIVDHELNDESNVVDVGAYTGDWIGRMSSRYDSNFYALEPVKKFYNVLDNKFRDNEKIKCYNFGLSTKQENMKIVSNGDASSIVNNNNNGENISLVDLKYFMDCANIHTIDLLQMNIEGFEYQLLNNWFDEGHIQNINKILIQFHKVDNLDFRKAREDIQIKLVENGYQKQFDYPFVWESWQKVKDL